MSGDDGLFDDPPILDITFSANHKSPGLTLLFYPYSDDYASEVRATWFNGAGEVIRTGIYEIDGTTGYIDQSVPSFRRIRLEFLKTNIRNRYIKMSGINYGEGQSMQDDTIDTASILEEIDPTSNEVTINTLGFKIRTKDPRFSIVSGLGDDMLMRNQPMTVIADDVEIGTFFLQSHKDVHGNGTVIEFSAIDAIGVMDQYPFYGDIYNNVTVESILDRLFAICFPTQLITYQLDGPLQGKRVSGWIPKGTCRTALQQICFAIGAVADDSRRTFVWIYTRDTELDHTIPWVYQGPTIQPTEYYSGVDVVAHEYAKGDEVAEAHKATYPVGRREVLFAEPLYDVAVSSGSASIVERSANHVILNVTAQSEIILTGKKYIVNQSVFSERDPDIPPGEVENVRTYSNCTMLAPTDAPQIAQSLYQYLRQRASFDGDVRLDNNEVGQVVEVPTAGHAIRGTIEQLGINLRGGRARMKVIGNVMDDPGRG